MKDQKTLQPPEGGSLPELAERTCVSCIPPINHRHAQRYYSSPSVSVFVRLADAVAAAAADLQDETFCPRDRTQV